MVLCNIHVVGRLLIDNRIFETKLIGVKCQILRPMSMCLGISYYILNITFDD